jgi:RimJ/RimL family protein N-acetyltransferase
MSDPFFVFRHVNPADAGLLRAWLEQPHIRRWWRPERSELMSRALDRPERSTEAPDACLALLDERPIGYIAGYRALSEPSGFWDEVENVTASTRAIEFLIGETDLVNRKLGRAMIRAFVVRQFEDPSVDRIVADPARDNWPANIALKRVGFRDRGRIDRPGVNAMLLTLARGVFKS